MHARWATAYARDIGTLIQATDAAFVGEVTALNEQREQSFGQESSAASGPVNKPVSRQRATFPVSVYEVAVRRSLHGPLAQGSSVAIEQLGGVTTGPDGSQARIILEGDELLEAGRTYLFFASIGPDGTITSAPFARFAVGSNGSLAALPDWAHLGIAARLAGMSVEGAAAEVQNAAP